MTTDQESDRMAILIILMIVGGWLLCAILVRAILTYIRARDGAFLDDNDDARTFFAPLFLPFVIADLILLRPIKRAGERARKRAVEKIEEERELRRIMREEEL